MDFKEEFNEEFKSYLTSIPEEMREGASQMYYHFFLAGSRTVILDLIRNPDEIKKRMIGISLDLALEQMENIESIKKIKTK